MDLGYVTGIVYSLEGDNGKVFYRHAVQFQNSNGAGGVNALRKLADHLEKKLEELK